MILKCHRVLSSHSGQDLGDRKKSIIKGNNYYVFAMFFDGLYGMQCMIQPEPEHSDSPILVYLRGFEVLSDYIPKDWVTQFYNKNNFQSITACPKTWDYKSFFEDLSNSDPKALRLYDQEAQKLIDTHPPIAPPYDPVTYLDQFKDQ